MGKKRKASPYEPTEETERTLYHSFVGAANAVSQLYTQAAQQQRRAASTSARHALVSAAAALLQRARQAAHPALNPPPACPQERVICHVLRENAAGDAISRSSLLQFLQQEYEVWRAASNAPPIVKQPVRRSPLRPAPHRTAEHRRRRGAGIRRRPRVPDGAVARCGRGGRRCWGCSGELALARRGPIARARHRPHALPPWLAGVAGEDQQGATKNVRSASSMFSPARRAAQHGAAGMDMQEGEQQQQQQQPGAAPGMPGFGYALPAYQQQGQPGGGQGWPA
jgi:hypothetical protein